MEAVSDHHLAAEIMPQSCARRSKGRNHKVDMSRQTGMQTKGEPELAVKTKKMHIACISALLG